MARRSHKSEKVNEAIKRALSEIFLEELPPEAGNMITVLRVDTAKDLSKAEVYISSLKDTEKIVEELNQKSGYIRYLLGQKIKIRKLPELHFIHVPELPL
ncbi:MAG: 30S ribosome-binding factor RbfA [Aquificae bacterium]|nr:30S ribosome-binding factor RbfA [Aquificota bacterium]